jgi:hypothetical protein
MQKRRYRLSKKGLQALRAAAHAHHPWTHSTGPKTRRGKRMTSLNAYKHGRRARLFTGF